MAVDQSNNCNCLICIKRQIFLFDNSGPTESASYCYQHIVRRKD